MKRHLYVVKGHGIADGLYKIGIANNVEKRLSAFSIFPFDTSLVAQFLSDDASRLESILHSHFDDYRERGEWFRLSPEFVSILSSATSVDDLLNTLGCNDVIKERSIGFQVSSTYGSAIRKLEAFTGKKYSVNDVAQGLGISRPSAYSLVRDESSTVNVPMLGRLLDFFQSEGLPVTIADLFTVGDE